MLHHLSTDLAAHLPTRVARALGSNLLPEPYWGAGRVCLCSVLWRMVRCLSMCAPFYMHVCSTYYSVKDAPFNLSTVRVAQMHVLLL